MKILVVNDQYNSGGAARVAAILCNVLVERGYDVHAVTSILKIPIRYHLSDRVVLHDVDFSSHGPGPTARFFSLFRTAKDIRRVVAKEKPDVIITVQANAFIRTFIGTIGYKIPLIAADHTSFARKMDFINTFTRHYLYKFADGLSILTKRDEKLLGKKYPQKRVIYNPLTFPLLRETTKRNKTILCVGRFDVWEIKGFDLMIQMWVELSRSYPDWELIFAGTGKNEPVNLIKGMVCDYNLDDRVRFLGQVDDMRTLYSHAGIFALPSRIEGFPMVLLEAMSQGCPCVAFNVGGASQEIIEDTEGCVIEDGDIDSFKAALSELMSSAEKRKICSLKSIESASRFTVDIFADKWENMIKDILDSQKRN